MRSECSQSAIRNHRSGGWMTDCLALSATFRLGLAFDVVLVSAVWQSMWQLTLLPHEGRRAFW